MIHIQNIPHILQEGFVHPASMRASRHYVSIGDAVVILKRNNRFIDQVHRISDYIPFYFGPRTPMLYVIQHRDGSISKILPGNIVYCVIKIEDIIRNHVDCIFTDGHALDGFTRCYPASELSNLNSIVSYNDVFSQCWSKEEDKDFKRRKEAELLVLDELGTQYIKGLVVYNRKAMEMLIQMGVSEDLIAIRQSFYY